jgi:hypothetical protein
VLVSAKLLYRIAAIVLVLFAAGHTAGFLTFQPSSPQGMAVREAMNSVRFELSGGKRSYAELYTGFSLIVTAYMLLAAFLAWHLGSIAAREPRSIAAIAWVFALVQVICFILSLHYFFLVPSVFSGVIVVCLVWAAWLLRSTGT